MKKLLIATIAFLGVAAWASFVLADDDKPAAQKITGILIDAKCGNKDGKPKSEEDAAKHPQACAIKCANGGSALQIISGEHAYKLDEASAAKAKEYLTKEKGDGATRVMVEGTVKEHTLTITSIMKAEKA